jgi:diaminopimelate decarboxylase
MSQPLSNFRYSKEGVLQSEGVSLDEVIELTGTPTYIYSAEGFLHPLKKLQFGLKGLNHLICFAVKANSNVHVLKLLADAGAGMDLVSGGELYRALHASVPADRIVFSGVGKTPGEMAAALEAGIFSFNVESLPELELLNAVAKRLNLRASVALRFNPDVDAKTHPYISTGLKKNKFGLERREILEIAKKAPTLSHIRIRGLSIHIGSQITSLRPLKDAFSRLRLMHDKLNQILREPLDFLDIGGGLGITYKAEKPPTLDAFCKVVVDSFEDISATDLPHPVKILMEPGRLLSGNSGVLVTEVLFRKERGKSKDFLILDAAMNDLMRPALYQSYHEIIPLERRKSLGKKKKTDLVGPVCETSDCFASDRPFPIAVKAGDLVAILSAGAYGFSMASTYNTRTRPAEVLIQDGNFRVIRHRESYEYLLRHELP